MQANTIPPYLVIFEMANNHMGSVDHGLAIIDAFADVATDFPEFRYALKLQYRDLPTFIHPAMTHRMDVGYIKRFQETRLDRSAFDQLIARARARGLLTMATPFDERSVHVIEEQALDFIKVASCSFGDWPLLERIARTERPIIASTAGVSTDVVDTVVSFFQHRDKSFALMHCVAEYPTANGQAQLNRIDFLRHRYAGVPIGFSTHEPPGETALIAMAIAKGATLFEKHVAVPTAEWPANAYSVTPDQMRQWLDAARQARLICGAAAGEAAARPQEIESLQRLRRGVFLKRPMAAGESVGDADVYFAFPVQDGQVTANDWSKYSRFTVAQAVEQDAPLMQAQCREDNRRAVVRSIAGRVRTLLQEGHITVPGGVDLEISHHYGMDRFDEYGLTMFTIVNRGYCKKLLVSLPGQAHPEQYHRQKAETFHVLYGEIELQLDGVPRRCVAGDIVNIEPGVRHAFRTTTGAVIEEISSTHIADDSFYTDDAIQRNPERKTWLTYWME